MLKQICVGMALGAVASTAALAADLPVRTEPPAPVVAPGPGLSFAVTPYTWAAGFSGDVGRRDRTLAHLDYDFSRVVDTMNFAAMGVVEARYGRYSLSSDLIYLRITDKMALNRLGGARLNVGVGLWQWTPLAGYAVYQDGRSSIDLVAGARLWSIKTLISAYTVNFGNREGDTRKSWVDAVAGIRARLFLNDNWFVSGWALAGAGGSDYMWDVMAGVGYQFNNWLSASVGYRAEQVKFEQSGFTFNTTVQGPIVSVQMSF